MGEEEEICIQKIDFAWETTVNLRCKFIKLMLYFVKMQMLKAVHRERIEQ